MQPRETRVGNKVSYNGVVYCLLCVSIDEPFLDNSKFFAGEITWKNLKGVCIEEEWLKDTIKGINYPKWIKYLHELQNWYYWTHKKKELELK